MIFTTERDVIIHLGIDDAIGDRLIEIRKQRDALLAKSRINLAVNADGIDQARRASARAQAASQSAMKDLSALGGAITSKAITPMAQYQTLMGAALQATRMFGAGAVSALRSASAEFQKQKDLAQFWGTSGYIHGGITSLKSSLSSFLTGGGTGFTSWLQGATSNLNQYRKALAASAAVMVGFAAVAGLSAKHAQNYITSTLDSRLMSRKLTDRQGAEKWVQSAQETDWSAGRASRMSVFQTVLSKNKAIGQQAAQKATEDIEKYFFANQEEMRKLGFASAEDLASRISAPQLVGDDATKFADKFGLGFETLSPIARLARLGTEAKDIDIDKAIAARPDEILTKRLTATTASVGDSVIPVLNTVLGMFLKISDAVGKIPGLGPLIGWGAVLTGAASAGLIVVSMIGTLIPGLRLVLGLTKASTAAHVAETAAKWASTAATTAATAAQWLLNAAMTANPVGIVIVAVAGLIVLLYALEKKFGLASKAWKMFSESSIGKGVFATIEGGKKTLDGLLASLNKVYRTGGAGGVIRLALDAMGNVMPIGIAIKTLLIVLDFIRKLWINSTTLNKLIDKGVSIWSRIMEFLNWLYRLAEGALKWIRDGLGITRSEAKEKMDTAAKKLGVEYAPSGASGAGWYKNAVRQFGSDIDRLDRLMDTYNKTPKGFFEGIPGINELTRAIEALTHAMQHPVAAASAAASSTRGAIANAAELTLEADIAAVDRQLASGLPVTRLSTDMGNPSGVIKVAYNTLAGLWPKMSAGGPITGSGSLIGHGGEEVTPARAIVGAKTTLERINEMFSGISAGGQPININAQVSVPVSIGKVDSNLDIDRLVNRIGNEGADKLLFALRNKMDNGSTRGIGYLRGG